jgi:hypothetical protein
MQKNTQYYPFNIQMQKALCVNSEMNFPKSRATPTVHQKPIRNVVAQQNFRIQKTYVWLVVIERRKEEAQRPEVQKFDGS